MQRYPAFLACALLLSSASLAETLATETAIYGLNETGTLTLNGTVLDKLPTRFDGRSRAFTSQRWWDLAILGPNRYALRRDGLLFENGAELDSLPSSSSDLSTLWNAICVTPTQVYALRADGLLFANGSEEADYPAAGFTFERLVCADPHVYALRSDGAVFEDDDTTPKFRFVGGAGVEGALDGASEWTSWTSLAIDPSSGDLYALRSDGELFLGELPSGDEAGERVASLPFPTSTVFAEDLYSDLELDSAGVWHVLRRNARLYSGPPSSTPLVELPSDDSNSRVDDLYLDLAVQGTNLWAMRFDGRLYRDDDEDLQLDLLKDRYRRIALGDEAPDLTHFLNPPPLAASYALTAIAGQPISVPVIVSDIEKLPDELVVSPVLLPVGVLWDAPTRTLGWASPGPIGSHTLSLQVDDGVNAARPFRYKIKVVAPDADPLKNKKPEVAQIKDARALVGVPFTLPILAVDRDGDTLTFSADTSHGPFTSGSPASFDTGTGIFSWTPEFEDIGEASARFTVSDGASTRSFSVKIRVASPLIF